MAENLGKIQSDEKDHPVAKQPKKHGNLEKLLGSARL